MILLSVESLGALPARGFEIWGRRSNPGGRQAPRIYAEDPLVGLGSISSLKIYATLLLILLLSLTAIIITCWKLGIVIVCLNYDAGSVGRGREAWRGLEEEEKREGEKGNERMTVGRRKSKGKGGKEKGKKEGREGKEEAEKKEGKVRE